MKELTVAQGKLRCGECASVFNAMDSLSTKLPEQDDPANTVSLGSLNQNPSDNYKTSANPKVAESSIDRRPSSRFEEMSSVWPLALAGLLTVTLISQVWLTRDLWINGVRQPEKVKMLSRKVFTHPSEPNALVITGAIENTASKAQPFPYLEARLLDSSNQTVALRRFKPSEYLERYEAETMLGSQQQSLIRLKIQDPPGNRAKQFKFSFR